MKFCNSLLVKFINKLYLCIYLYKYKIISVITLNNYFFKKIIIYKN